MRTTSRPSSRGWRPKLWRSWLLSNGRHSATTGATTGSRLSTSEKSIESLSRQATKIFKPLAVHALREHLNNEEDAAFQQAISLEGGEAETAFYCVYKLFRSAEHCQISQEGHFAVNRCLRKLIGEIEDFWHDRQYVPPGWEEALGAALEKAGSRSPFHSSDMAVEAALPCADQEQRVTPAGGPSPLRPKPDRTAAQWRDFGLFLVSDDAVEITIGSKTSIKNFHELGFVDRRKKSTSAPNQAWVMLRILAWHRGTIEDAENGGQAWPKVEKRIQEIRRVLRRLTGIQTDPLPYISGTGYQAQFRIGCAPAYHSDKQPDHPCFDAQVREAYLSEVGRRPAHGAYKPEQK